MRELRVWKDLESNKMNGKIDDVQVFTAITNDDD